MGHQHSHSHGPASYNRAFVVGILLNVTFVVVEFGYGRATNSLALMADASHNLSDVLGLVLAWGASLLAARAPSHQRTYGLRRTTILAALINAMTLLFAVGGILWEAIHRFTLPLAVGGQTVIWVALLGMLLNGVTAAFFLSGRHGDLNVRGAFLHMAADAGVSLGVALAGGAMLLTGWLWLDPLVSIVIALIILVGTWGLLRDSVNLAVDGVPRGINLVAVQQHLQQIPWVANVHDLHIWAMSTTEVALTAHLLLRENHVLPDSALAEVTQRLHDTFGIEHTTLQVEHASAASACQCSVGALLPH